MQSTLIITLLVALHRGSSYVSPAVHSPFISRSCGKELTTSCSALFISSDYTDTNAMDTSTSKMELLDSRLTNVGAKGYQFVGIDDNHDKDDNDEKKESTPSPTAIAEPVHVKTLIWEAVLVVPCSSGSGRTIEEVVDHYFVTALRVEDRVDLQRLYDLVKVHSLESSTSDMESGRLMLRLAKRDVSETLAGYQSGTIPPIAHTTPMPLYIDEVVARDDSLVASVGSGAMGYDLFIPMKEMIRIAQLTSATHIHALSLKKQLSKQVSQPSNNDNMQRLEKANDTPTTLETQMASTKGKAARANLLRKAAKRKGTAEVLRRMLDDIGDEFPTLMEVEEYGFGGIDKNALHHAAWKGDLESLTLLIEKGKRFGLDLVNRISCGGGNYGKTPIFYSLTQCREDAVLLLIAQGADLLIVNNKGQTPCSIAVSHLKPEICQLLYDIEASQLQGGGTFKNYRTTHSDGKRYGDLDPRFDIDDDNMDDDIIPELEAYHQIVNNATGSNIEDAASDERYDILQTTTIPGLPRSIRETTRHWKIPRTQSVGNDTIGNHNENIGSLKGQSKRALSEKIRSEPAEDDIDYDSLEKLTFESSIINNNHRVRVVDDMADISELSDVIDKSVAATAAHTSIEQEEMALSDAETIFNSWGLDCEWQPSYTKGQETPVATLQLHHTGTGSSFLIDVQVLLNASIAEANAPMTETERMLSDALTKIFPNRYIVLLGFGVAMDLGKLAASFPHIPCFRRFENVIDLHTVSRNLYAGSSKTYMSSLQKMVAVLLDMGLDKKEQCSDWKQRPLTSSQVDYALLDAAILPILLRTMLCGNDGVAERYEGMFIHKHPHLRSTTKLTCLGFSRDLDQFACAPQLAYRVPYGSCKIHLQHIMSRQMFTTGKDDPDPPELLTIEEQQSIALSRIPKDKRPKKKDTVHENKGRKFKKKTLKLSCLAVDFRNLPTPGKIIGYTKDACIHELLGKEFIESLSDHTRLGFNRRGGVLDFQNLYCLFVNFALSESGGLPSHWLYRNDFLDNGRRLTFTVNAERDQERALMEFFALHKRSTDAFKVLLFTRTSTKAKFMYCGECACSNQSESRNYTNLVLELIDYDKLATGSTNGVEPSTFMEMVASHAAALAEERAVAGNSS